MNLFMNPFSARQISMGRTYRGRTIPNPKPNTSEGFINLKECDQSSITVIKDRHVELLLDFACENEVHVGQGLVDTMAQYLGSTDTI